MIDNDKPDASSIRTTARLAGLVYLVTACLMVFSFMVQPRAFIVNGDAAATAQRILAGESMYRVMVLTSLIAQVLFIFVALLLHQLFRDVDRWHARAMAVLVLVAIAADLVVTANRLAPIDHLVGILVTKSGWFPRVLGILLMIAGIGYVVTSIAFFVAPAQLKTIRQIMTPIYLGEVPIILWMLIRGAKLPDAAPAG